MTTGTDECFIVAFEKSEVRLPPVLDTTWNEWGLIFEFLRVRDLFLCLKILSCYRLQLTHEG